MPSSKPERSKSAKKTRDTNKSSRGKTRKGPRAARRVDPALSTLIEISHSVGANPDLVQGGGGNTSVKSSAKSSGEARMFVKASGTALVDMDESRGYAEVELAKTLAMLGDRRLSKLGEARREAEVLRLLESAVIGPLGARPSVEDLPSRAARFGRDPHARQSRGSLICPRRTRERVGAVCSAMSPNAPSTCRTSTRVTPWRIASTATSSRTKQSTVADPTSSFSKTTACSSRRRALASAWPSVKRSPNAVAAGSAAER